MTPSHCQLEHDAWNFVHLLIANTDLDYITFCVSCVMVFWPRLLYNLWPPHIANTDINAQHFITAFWLVWTRLRLILQLFLIAYSDFDYITFFDSFLLTILTKNTIHSVASAYQPTPSDLYYFTFCDSFILATLTLTTRNVGIAPSGGEIIGS